MTVVDWASRSPVEIPMQVRRIVLAGDSAGGTLAAACASRGKASLDLICALWTMYSGFEMNAEGGSKAEFASGFNLTAEMMDLFRDAYFRSDADRSKPDASPALIDDLSDFPRSLIMACECDPLRDQSRAFAARLALNGVSVIYREAKGHIHGCLRHRAVLPSAQELLLSGVDDLKRLLSVDQGRSESTN